MVGKETVKAMKTLVWFQWLASAGTAAALIGAAIPAVGNAAIDEQETKKSDSADGAKEESSKTEAKPKLEYPIHDFSRLTGRDEDSCGSCHVPHVQAGGEEIGPFEFARRFPQALSAKNAPGPTSMICLTCHNGTVASSTIGTAHAMGGVSSASSTAGAATRDHPIGVAYPDRKKGFRARATVEAEGIIRLPGGRIECISCHDHHEEEELPYLLVMSNKRSALCLSCHEK